mgnify:FL=1
MEFEIVKVHTTTYSESNESDIQKVRLSDGSDELVEQVVRYIDNNFEYYFTAREGLKTKVETVHTAYSGTDIRTKANQITSDNLLSLPRF